MPKNLPTSRKTKNATQPAGNKKSAAKAASPKNELQAKVNKALAMIAAGESVKRSCGFAGVPITTFLDNVDGERYARARDSQADVHFAELHDLAEDVRVGTLDPQAGRVAADIVKWRLARMKPKSYGDKLNVDAKLDADLTIKWGKE